MEISKCAVRYYEGEVTTKDEHDGVDGTRSVSDTEASGYFARVYNHPNGHHIIIRSFFLFDMSVIGSDEISSAVFSVYVTSTQDTWNDGDDFVKWSGTGTITGFSPVTAINNSPYVGI